jgi:hypothetical protein
MTGTSERPGYEICDRRNDSHGRPRIEARAAGVDWPVVCATVYGHRWLVLIDREVIDMAGLGAIDLNALRR